MLVFVYFCYWLLDTITKITVTLWDALSTANKILSRHMDFYPHPIRWSVRPSKAICRDILAD